MPTLTGADALVHTLQRHKVEVLFALPGVQIMPAFDALARLPGIRLITTRHEQATTYMADGYARTSGKVGVALVVPGPGVLNASAGLGTAYACSSPVVLLAGQIESWGLGKEKGLLHEIREQLDILRPLTKWCARALKPQEVPGLVAEAIRQAQSGRPRPTAVEIPPDVLVATAPMHIPEPAPPALPHPDPQAVRRAAALLKGAKQVAIWAGGGAVRSPCARDLLEVARILQAPILLTPEGKGAVPEEHPLCAGANYYGFGPAQWVVPQCDVLLGVGTRFLLPTFRRWAPKPPQRLVQIDADPQEIGRNYPAEVGIVADARLGLQALVAELGDARPDRQGEAIAQQARQRALYEVREAAPLQVRILEALRSALADDAILVAGVTNVAYWANLAYPARLPNTYLTSSYFATLGYAFPTSLGAKVAHPTRQVVSINGDGGFLYNAQELATAVKERLPVVAMVFADGAFGASKNDQRTRYGGRYLGTDLYNPDFVRLAESYGAVGIRARPEEVGQALQTALKATRPVVIEVPIPTLPPPFQMDR
ncbi:MAG: thiamine pyrophosphate-binding protein [Dehalococcoidia bacterium]|nr:thiamine pyrophosphate-binding protein [Dehalococcoidia bacterium]